MRKPEITPTMRNALFIVGLILFVPAATWLQAAEWTVYNTANSGLPYNGVTALAIDAQGTIWVGTGRWWAFAGGGLARFDGENWTVYNTINSGLPNSDHTSLSIDADGNVWSGTENGLSKFDGQNWTVYTTQNSGMRDNQCGAPVFDDEGNAWLFAGALVTFDGQSWTAYHTGNSGLPHNFVTGIDIDTDGNIWAGTFGGGVARFDGTNWTVYNTGNSALPHNDVSFLAADGEGNVWAGTYGGGLAMFDGIGWTPYTQSNSGLPNDWIWNLDVDPQGNVWAGTRAGLARFDGATWTVYNRANSGLPDNNVYCVAFDGQGGIWIGTQDGGLALFQPQPRVDLNGDGMVDMNDLLRLIESWDRDDPACDIGPTTFGDGIVDAADLEVLVDYWQQEVDDRTLLAHWRLDEAEGATACDSAGNCDGAVCGDPLWQPDGGAVGGALALDGNEDFVAADFVLDLAEGPFSALAWIKGGAPGQVIVSQQEGADWLAAAATGGLSTGLQGNRRGAGALTSEAVITDGLWHRVALVWDGLCRSLYVDGTLVAEDEQGSLTGCSGGLNIGCGKDMAPESFFTGLIDDVRIYNRAVEP